MKLTSNYMMYIQNWQLITNYKLFKYRPDFLATKNFSVMFQMKMNVQLVSIRCCLLAALIPDEYNIILKTFLANIT